MRIAVAAVVAAAAGCGSFEDPNIVIDLRVLAMAATPPNQVVDVDLSAPPDPVTLFDQLVPTQICALVADPAADRRLTWSVEICPFSGDAADGRRCVADKPRVAIASGTLDDPDITAPEPALCVTVNPDAGLFGVLASALEDDDLKGVGGIDYDVELRIGGVDADRTLDQFASKTVRVSPRIPAALTANTNPRLAGITTTAPDGSMAPLPLVRCADNPAPLAMPAGTKLRLLPVEPDGVREVYVAPTLDGSTQTFTESLTYQWIASGGDLSHGSTGGPHDLSGNPAPLFTDFKAPDAIELMGPTDYDLWIVQRDERLGAQWYEACLRVMP